MSAAARRAPAPKPIRSLASLRDHLQTAMEIEHATIPPYFTAWVSSPHGVNVEAAEIIRSVMLEEMLHLTLAANLLNAVGGQPNLTYEGFVPSYPHTLPHSGAAFEVSVERLSPAALETFLKIERPEPRGARPEAGHWKTIGQFYAAIEEGIAHLCSLPGGEEEVFVGRVSDQVRPQDYYGSGQVVVVTDRASAMQAIGEIVEQGEGAPDGIFDGDAAIFPADGDDGTTEEVAHYYRFKEVLEGRRYVRGDTPDSGPSGDVVEVDWDAVYPIRSNTRAADYPVNSEIRVALERFSGLYGDLLASLENAFNGDRSNFTVAMAQMFALRDAAVALMRTPSGDGRSHVGLAFEPPLTGKRPSY